MIQTATSIENIATDAGNAAWYIDGAKFSTSIKGRITYCYHCIRDDGIHTSGYEGIAGSIDNSVAIIARIVVTIVLIHFNR